MTVWNKELANILDAWEEWLAKERRYAPHTVSAYVSDVDQFFTFVQPYEGEAVSPPSLEAMQPRTFRAWLAGRAGEGLSPPSQARALSSLRSFFRYVRKFHGIENNAIVHLRQPKQPKRVPRPVSAEHVPETVQALRDSSPTTRIPDWVHTRNEALLLLIYATGMRIGEALSVTPAMLGLTQQGESPGEETWLMTIRGKGQKERRIPVLPVARQAIVKYLHACPHAIEDTNPLFVGVRGKILNPAVFQRVVRQMRDYLNLPESVTPHAFRHSFATHLLQQGVNLRSIQMLLGHESLASTQHYMKLDTMRLLSAYQHLHPRAKVAGE